MEASKQIGPALFKNYLFNWGFPDGSVGKESICNAGDPGLILGWEDPLEKGKATFLAALNLCCCIQALSSCTEQGPLSSCGVRASPCVGFS